MFITPPHTRSALNHILQPFWPFTVSLLLSRSDFRSAIFICSNKKNIIQHLVSTKWFHLTKGFFFEHNRTGTLHKIHPSASQSFLKVFNYTVVWYRIKHKKLHDTVDYAALLNTRIAVVSSALLHFLQAHAHGSIAAMLIFSTTAKPKVRQSLI